MLKIDRDIHGNPHFEKLRAQLEAEGYVIRCMLQARSIDSGVKFKYPDVEIWQVIGTEKSPAIASIVVRDMPFKDGTALGLWVEAPSARIEENVRQIIGRLATVDELVKEEEAHTSR